MIFFDINTFFAHKAGGIRTFYNARLSFFGQQQMHRYVLAFPGPRYRTSQQSPAVTLIEAYGPQISQVENGYRFMLDYFSVFRALRKAEPDVVEVGDPWLTGLLCLLLRKLGIYRGLLVSFYHSDPIMTHVEPWVDQGRGKSLKTRLILVPLGALFYRVQRSYDVTVVASEFMQRRLGDRGVKAIRCNLGLPSCFVEPYGGRIGRSGRDVRVLYCGRLNLEKGIRLVQELVPQLLEFDHVSVTVVGRGGAAGYFSALKHPRFQYLGFVEDPLQMRDIYDAHDILLAPGPFESFGLAILEAMARGLVVIGPDSGGTGEILTSANTPFRFSAGSSADFRRVAMMAIDCNLQLEGEAARAFALSVGTLEAAMGRLAERYASMVAEPQIIGGAQ